jgi:hypothetical protein
LDHADGYAEFAREAEDLTMAKGIGAFQAGVAQGVDHTVVVRRPKDDGVRCEHLLTDWQPIILYLAPIVRCAAGAADATSDPLARE